MSGSPINTGPFIAPWPGNLNIPNTPRNRTPGGALRANIGSGGGGVTVPFNSAPTYSLERFTYINSSLDFDVGLTSSKIIDEPSTYRNFLLIRNTSGDLAVPTAAIVRLNFGAPATLRSAVRLNVNETILFDAVVPQDDLYAIADVAGSIAVMVGTIVLPGS